METYSSPELEYMKAQKASGIHVGDQVIVTRKAEMREQGWGMPWIPEMDECIGNCFEVTEIDGILGMKLKGRQVGGAWFPYFVLQPIYTAIKVKPTKGNGYRRIIL